MQFRHKSFFTDRFMFFSSGWGSDMATFLSHKAKQSTRRNYLLVLADLPMDFELAGQSNCKKLREAEMLSSAFVLRQLSDSPFSRFCILFRQFRRVLKRHKKSCPKLIKNFFEWLWKLESFSSRTDTNWVSLKLFAYGHPGWKGVPQYVPQCPPC